MSDKITQSAVVQTLIAETVFEDFQSLTLIDAGAADGFQLAGNNDAFGVIPTGIVINLGGVNGRVPIKFTVKAAAGKSLNVTAILYQ